MTTNDPILLTLLWHNGNQSGASFPIGLPAQTPREAAELCGMRDIEELGTEGDIVARNKWDHEIVIMDVDGRGPIAVDITFQRVVENTKNLGRKRPRYQPLKQASRPPSDSGDGSDRAKG